FADWTLGMFTRREVVSLGAVENAREEFYEAAAPVTAAAQAKQARKGAEEREKPTATGGGEHRPGRRAVARGRAPAPPAPVALAGGPRRPARGRGCAGPVVVRGWGKREDCPASRVRGASRKAR